MLAASRVPLRDRGPFAGRHLTSTTQERQSDLLGEEGIAARHLMEAEERGSREILTHLVEEHPFDGVRGQRSDVDGVLAILGEDRHDAQGIVVGFGAPNGSHQADRLVLQAPHDELEHPDRGEIHPLDVIDRHDDGGGRGHRPEASEDGQGNGPLVGAGARTRGSQGGDLESPALRLGHGRECLLEDGLEEVTEGGVRQARLRFDRAARERAVAPKLRPRQPLLPHGGLADAGISRQEHGARPGRDRVQEAMEDRELRLAPDDVTGQ
jgi:hypothetical protein